MATSRITGPSPLHANDRAGGFLSHLGVREQPFGVTPDPVFLFSSRVHRAAFQSMVAAIESNLGFTVLVGDPGMGKTTLLFQLLTQYRNSARTAFIFQTQCKRQDLLRHLALEFDLPVVKGDEVLLHQSLKDVLVNEAAAGRKVLVIIDEAQNLHASSLEAIRLLSDFETTKAKLLHIILAGSARLSETLQSPELSQLAQRISTVCRLEPLSPEEVKAYVNFRLTVAGYRGTASAFSSEALAEVAWYSAGVPRLINSICYGALCLAYNRGKRQVEKELVQQAARNLDLSCRSVRGEDLAGTNDSLEKEHFADPWPALKEPAPQSAAIDLHETRPADPRAADPGAAASASPLTTASSSTSTKDTPISAPRRSPSTGFEQESILQATERGAAPIGDLGLPRNRTGASSKRHAMTPRFRFWTGDRVALAIAAPGILVLLLWAGWYDQRVNSEMPLRHSASANPLAGSPESKYSASTNSASSAQQPIAPGIAAEQQNANLDTGPADRKAGNSSRAPLPVSVSAMPSKLNRRAANETEATTPDNAVSLDVASSSTLDDRSRVLSTPAEVKVSLQPTRAEANLRLPLGPLAEPIKVVKPEYPKQAQLKHIEGDVLVELQVDPTGKVRNVRSITGNSLLTGAAEEAARQWQYAPFPADQAGGLAVTLVQFNFKLNPE